MASVGMHSKDEGQRLRGPGAGMRAVQRAQFHQSRLAMNTTPKQCPVTVLMQDANGAVPMDHPSFFPHSEAVPANAFSTKQSHSPCSFIHSFAPLKRAWMQMHVSPPHYSPHLRLFLLNTEHCLQDFLPALWHNLLISSLTHQINSNPDILTLTQQINSRACILHP
eukprot:1153867-Pelagomonas_calceolata.AAC.1